MKDKIRTIGLYQPFGSLMLPPYNKIETRWVREGRTPPFPEGEYLIYTTKTPCNMQQMEDWCGDELALSMFNLLINETTVHYNGYAIAKATLVKKWILTEEDENTYIKFIGKKIEIIKGIPVIKIQWGMKFIVEPIKPFKWNYGKQGVGIVPDSELSKIQPLTEIINS